MPLAGAPLVGPCLRPLPGDEHGPALSPAHARAHIPERESGRPDANSVRVLGLLPAYTTPGAYAIKTENWRVIRGEFFTGHVATPEFAQARVLFPGSSPRKAVRERPRARPS